MLESIIGKVQEKISHIGQGGEKELSMKDQDVKILERDLIGLESGFPERKDVLTKAKMLVKDNYRLREMLAEQN